jgi:hypothetical protein
MRFELTYYNDTLPKQWKERGDNSEKRKRVFALI